MPSPDVSVVVCTYQMPRHLERVLASLEKQTLADRMEVVVSDDGSTDETPVVVRRFAAAAPFPVRFVTHPHRAFELARCRNEGFRAASAPIVIFLDGDCLAPPDHVQQHLARLRPGVVTNSYCIRLDEAASRQITLETVRGGQFVSLATLSQRRKLAVMHLKSVFYHLIGHRRKPTLRGGNVGICREDFLRVNGVDENFCSWGGEDDDFGWRLRAAKVRIVSILNRTRTYHLWHPPAPTKVQRHRDQHHHDYLHRPLRLVRCLHGLVHRRPEDLHVRIAGAPADLPRARQILSLLGLAARPRTGERLDLEFLFYPGAGRFTGEGDGRVLVALDESPAAAQAAQKAHLVLSPSGMLGGPKQGHIKLGDAAGFWQALGRTVVPGNLTRAA
jgi:glycosyltransferase involved in cell wall biosynthesis